MGSKSNMRSSPRKCALTTALSMIWGATFLTVFGLSCGEGRKTPFDNTPVDEVEYEYSVPVATDDGWDTAHCDSVGIDHTLIENLVNEISNETMPDLNSILIVRDGKLVFEEYFNGWPPDSLHMLMSCTKSVTSALVGIAINEGYLSGIDTGIYSFFPEYDEFRTPRKDSMLLRHTITMTGGLKWDQSSYEYDDPANSLYQLWACGCNWISYILALDDLYTPGTEWEYSDAMALTTGEVLCRAVGMPVTKWAEQKLFMPLEIDRVEWRHTNGSYTNTGYGLYMRSRDMAKFGQMYLDGGQWKGQQVVSQAWVNESTAEAVPLSAAAGYGYYWWRVRYRLDDDSYVNTVFAMGNQGQMIYLVPSSNAVVVFTMTRPSNKGYDEARWAMVNHIFPALQ
ncbi:MAG: serine hydrolase [Candidatus Zixiibacteriota bacterium]|nr:MAG: serine hydrolase [candidate division Zixibacteria bacterium]